MKRRCVTGHKAGQCSDNVLTTMSVKIIYSDIDVIPGSRGLALTVPRYTLNTDMNVLAE